MTCCSANGSNSGAATISFSLSYEDLVMHNSQSVSVATAFKDGSQEVCVSAVVSVFEMTSFLPLVFASNVFLIYLPV